MSNEPLMWKNSQIGSSETISKIFELKYQKHKKGNLMLVPTRQTSFANLNKCCSLLTLFLQFLK